MLKTIVAAYSGTGWLVGGGSFDIHGRKEEKSRTRPLRIPVPVASVRGLYFTVQKFMREYGLPLECEHNFSSLPCDKCSICGINKTEVRTSE